MTTNDHPSSRPSLLIAEAIRPISREEAVSDLISGDPQRMGNALLRSAHHDPEWRWVEEQCVRFASHADSGVRGMCAIALDHVARVHRALEIDKVLPVLEALLRDRDAWVRAEADGALDSIRSYLSGEGILIWQEDTTLEVLDWSRLLAPQTAWARFVPIPEPCLDDFGLSRTNAHAATVVRIIRGRRSTTSNRLFQEWAAALQFPCGFEPRWDALAQQLETLSWPPGGAFVFLITHVDAVLRGHERQFRRFVSILESVAAEWAMPVLHGPDGSRPAVPFRVVFHADPSHQAAARERLTRVGISL